MSPEEYEVVEAARATAGMSFDDLWLAYFALGGAAAPSQLHLYLAGQGQHTMDYDVLVHALNEAFTDRGEDSPVPYREDLL